MQDLFRKRSNRYIALGVVLIGILTIFIWHNFSNRKAFLKIYP